jgi:tetratricopeptide (TPR) repeat protein
MRIRLVLISLCIALLNFASPADAFSRAGCFPAPTAMRPISAMMSQLRMSLGYRLPAETRACYLYARGQLYHLQGDYGHAIDDYSSAIAWMPSYGDAYAARADAYDAAGQHDKAAQDYAAAAQYSNDTPDELTERCWLRALRGRPLQPALADCDTALRQQPGDFDALSSRGLVYLRLGNLAAAIADCDAALAQKPRNGSALFIRALAKLRSGDVQGGNTDLAAAKNAGSRVEETFAIYGLTPQSR